jgi:uncharacterized phage protein (TIGR01671 family)
MRERDHEYRAFHIGEKKMYNDVAVMLCPHEIREWRVFTGSDGEFLGNDKHFEIMQYIGMRDKNNVKIFEGDIVHIRDRGNGFIEVWTVEYDTNEARFIVYNQLNSSRGIEADTCSYEIYQIPDGGGIAGAVEVCEGYGFVCEVLGNKFQIE